MTGRRLPPLAWTVKIEAHEIPPRWACPRTTLKVTANTELGALENAIGIVQRQAGCPPWKPCRRASLPYATARRVSA